MSCLVACAVKMAWTVSVLDLLLLIQPTLVSVGPVVARLAKEVLRQGWGLDAFFGLNRPSRFVWAPATSLSVGGQDRFCFPVVSFSLRYRRLVEDFSCSRFLP